MQRFFKKKEFKMRNTYLEIDTKAIKYNIESIQKHVGEGVSLFPVIKADAYGTGVASTKEALAQTGIKTVVVAIVDEALELKRNGFTQDIIILNGLSLANTSELCQVVELGLIPAVSLVEIAEKLNDIAKALGKIQKIHIELETGMGRTGVKKEDMLAFVRKLSSLGNIEIEGMFSHFSSADSSPEYTAAQLKIFKDVKEELAENGFEFKYYHLAASSGIIAYPEAYFNAVRPGIILRGYYPSEDMRSMITLKPATKLKSEIVYIKDVEPGTAISYSRTFVTDKPSRIATIPMGYADGLRRELSNKGRVLVNGQYAPIVGRICMDNFMIDITGLDANLGDEIVLWDNDKVTLEEIADICGTINYEILCGISERVPRITV